MCFGDKDHRGKGSLSSHYIKCTYNEHDFINSDINLAQLPEIGFARFLHSKVTFCFLSILCSVEEGDCAELILKQQSICCMSVKMD